MNVDIKKIIDLRMRLHRMPELSGEEIKTSAEVEKFVAKFNPDKIISLGKTGKAFVFDSGEAGQTVMFRAELDALPIDEPEEIFNKSLIKGVSHKCGHDGHIAILAGLAEAISRQRPKKGRVVLLFQPAEETLQGARTVIDDDEFKQIEPDLIFALHNLPGYPSNSIVVKKGNFTAATNGITIRLTGKPSHAAYPKKALNPTVATVRLLQFLHTEILKFEYKDFVLSTPVYTRIGTPDFGITPGDAEVKVTLRAFDYGDLDKMIGFVQNEVQKIAFKYKLKFRITYTDDAPPVFNSEEGVEIVVDAAIQNDFEIIEPKKPFKWTEDFGYYTIKYKGAFFGFGAGNLPELHDKKYQFDDNLLLPAIKMLFTIYSKTNL